MPACFHEVQVRFARQHVVARVFWLVAGGCGAMLPAPPRCAFVAQVEWLLWHPKGHAILAGSADTMAWMWWAPTGKLMQIFAGSCGGNQRGPFLSIRACGSPELGNRISVEDLEVWPAASPAVQETEAPLSRMHGETEWS